MARKSKQQRLSEAENLIQIYQAMGLQETREMQFLSDMILRLNAGKPLSSGMRKWFDSLVEAGAPSLDQTSIKRIDTLLEGEDAKHRESVLNDFRRQLQSGRQLSERQKKFLDIIGEEIQDLRDGKGFQITDEQKVTLERCNAFFVGTSPYYWAHRRGTANMLWSIFDQYKNTHRVTQKQFETVCNVFKVKLGKIEKPRFQEGDLAFLCKGSEKLPCVIMSALEVTDTGEFKYEILRGSEKISAACNLLKKR